MFSTVVIVTLLQSPLLLPSVPVPDGFLGGANEERFSALGTA